MRWVFWIAAGLAVVAAIVMLQSYRTAKRPWTLAVIVALVVAVMVFVWIAVTGET
jgi:hypothetical protein